MIDVYAIGSTLKLTDLVTPQLLKLSQQFMKVDALALQVNKRLKAMGAEAGGVRNLATAAKRLDVNLSGVGRKALAVEKNLLGVRKALPAGGLTLDAEFRSASAGAAALGLELKGITAEVPGLRAASRAIEAMATAMTAASLRAGMLHSHMQSIITAGGALPRIQSGGGAVGGGGGGGGGGRRGGGGHLHGGNLHVGPHGFGIGGVGMGLGSDMLVPLAAAGSAVYVGHKFYEAAKDYEMAFARFKTLNLGASINDDANNFARGTKQFGVSMTERMTILRDMHEVMGSYEEAKAVTPLFSRMLAANKGIFGEAGNRFDTKTFQALGKVIEMRGGTKSEHEMYTQADFAQRVLTGSAGLVTPTDLLAFAKTGGVATRLLSNRAFYEESAPMIQEMGGSKFGTALMSAHQNLAMGRGTLKSMVEASRLGLIDPKMIEYTKIGTIKQVLPGALKNDDLYNTSKFEWLKQVLIPAIRAKGVRTKTGLVTGDAVTDDQIVNELNTIFSQRTASNAFAQMYLQREKIGKNIGVTDKAMGIKELEDSYKKSPAGAEDEFDAAWTDFKTEFGKNMLPQVTSMLKTGADILRSLGDLSNSPTFKAIQSFGEGAVHAFEWPYRLFGSDKSSSPSGQTAAINPVADKTTAPPSLHGSVHLDGQKVGSFMADHLGRMAGKPQNMSGTFDGLMTLRPPSMR